jgi:hypothetical protein
VALLAPAVAGASPGRPSAAFLGVLCGPLLALREIVFSARCGARQPGRPGLGRRTAKQFQVQHPARKEHLVERGTDVGLLQTSLASRLEAILG